MVEQEQVGRARSGLHVDQLMLVAHDDDRPPLP